MSVLVSRVDTALLYPAFWARLDALLRDASAQGSNYWVVSGFRSYVEQGALYDQGRTEPGEIVTWAQPGESAHNFGVAADLCRDLFIERKGLQPDYRPESYEALRELAPKHGLVWGGTWNQPDRPHLNLPGFVTRVQLIPLRAAYEAGGLSAAFEYLSHHT